MSVGKPIHLKMKIAILIVSLFLFAFSNASSDPIAPALKASSLTGIWMLNGSVRAVQFNLKSDGTFQHRGYGSKSSGRWNVEGAQVRLRWTHIDTMAVDAKKVTSVYPLESGTLKIGKFEYRKAVVG